jgi:signal transduction histidine kinase
MLGRIDEAFQRQRQFTGDAAHELRTPLALMRSQIDLALTQADTSEELRDALQALDGDVGQMTTLVGTLLAIARADAGALTPNRESVDLADLASDVCDQYAPIASQNGLTLTCEVHPVTVQADADMIIQVIVNLVDNAIKNTAEGGTITIRTGRGTGVSSQGSPGLSSRESRHEPPPPDSWPRLTIDAAFVQVTDTGAGIPAEHLPRIFDRFYRVDSGRTRNKGGIGLGLAISQSIARVHGGMLSATSVPGKGSTFTLTLPA